MADEDFIWRLTVHPKPKAVEFEFGPGAPVHDVDDIPDSALRAVGSQLLVLAEKFLRSTLQDPVDE